MTRHCGNCNRPVSNAWARVYSVDGVVYCCVECSNAPFRTRPNPETVRAIVESDECLELTLDEGEPVGFDAKTGGGD